jgi:hypothetical protein
VPRCAEDAVLRALTAGPPGETRRPRRRWMTGWRTSALGGRRRRHARLLSSRQPPLAPTQTAVWKRRERRTRNAIRGHRGSAAPARGICIRPTCEPTNSLKGFSQGAAEIRLTTWPRSRDSCPPYHVGPHTPRLVVLKRTSLFPRTSKSLHLSKVLPYDKR